MAFFTAPTAFRAIRKEDPDGKFIRQYDLSKFRTLFLAGERADPPTVDWAEQQLKVPVIDHWWQTETGWCIAGNPVGLGHAAGKARLADGADAGLSGRRGRRGRQAAARRHHGLDRDQTADAAGVPADACGSRTSAARKPISTNSPATTKPPTPATRTRTATSIVMGRTDDIINVAGHRLSTGGMEEILASHPDVAECAVLGIKDAIKGEAPCGFLVLKAGRDARTQAEIEKEIVALVREKLGPVAAFKLAITVARLPKTRSGKILRGTIKKIADGDAVDHARHHRGSQGAGGDPGRAEGEGVTDRHSGRASGAITRGSGLRASVASRNDGGYRLTIPAIAAKQSREKLTGKSHATEHFDHLCTDSAALALSACASRNEIPVSSLGEDDDAICRANNVAVGSSDYVACRKNRDVQRGNAAAKRRPRADAI